MYKIFALFTVILSILYLLFPLHSARAAVSSCSASVSPTKVNTSTTKDFTFNVSNTSSSDIVNWVKFPSEGTGNLNINSGNASGWTATVQNPGEMVFSGGTIAAGSSTNFTANITIGATEAPAEVWSVQVSDAGGASPTECSGSPSITISNGLVISSIVVSDVIDSQVKITWTTNESSNSVVDYGTTASYDSTKSDSSNVTSHSINLTNLSANTTYHYKIKGTDASNNTAESGDNTFVTAKSGTTGTTQTGTTTTTTTKTTPKAVVDSTLPIVSINNDFSKPFKTAPLITGKAIDNTAVSKIEYSIDDGRNWLPADTVGSLGAKSTSFSFTPVIFEDGNYKVRVRAKDPTGNTGVSRTHTLVIDRLLPQVGGVIYSIGAQILVPNKDGVVFALAGLDQKITLSAVGGPTTIDVLSGTPNLPAGRQMYSLVKNIDNGLWSGVLSFSKPGIYQLTAKTVDGAGNKTQRELSQVVVLESGQVTGENKPLKDAKVSVYYFEPTSRRFILWDGKSFGQENPQRTDENGKYQLIVPPGRYYLQISTPGFKTLKTEIFNLDEALPVNTNLNLNKAVGLKIGPFNLFWPFGQESTKISISYPNLPTLEKENLAGRELPVAELFSGEKKVGTSEFKGKPTILSLMSTWSPNTSEQLVILDQLTGEFNVRVVMEQESASKVDIFTKRGGYKSIILSDPDGVLVEPLNILTFPTHIFVDRKGIIRGVVSGVLTKDKLLENMVN